MSKLVYLGALLASMSLASWAQVSLTVSQPVDGGSYSSPVPFQASASSPQGISGWDVYVDDNLALQNYDTSGTLDTSIAMGSGPHYIVVKAWDNGGNNTPASMNINVTGSGLIPTPPSNATQLANLEDNQTMYEINGWDPCNPALDVSNPPNNVWGVCINGCGAPSNNTCFTHVSSPSVDGTSLDAYNQGNATTQQWGKLYYIRNGPYDWATNYEVQWEFQTDTDWSNVQALEFDFPTSISNLWFYFGSQCSNASYGDGFWDYWNPNPDPYQGAGVHGWHPTNVPCGGFAANTWHTVKWFGTRTSTQFHYVALEVDGQDYNIDIWLDAPTIPPPGWDDQFIVQFQPDGNYAGAGYNMYVDNIQAWLW